MRRLRIIAALLVATGSLFWASPAHADTFTDWTTGYNVNKTADCVQFSYTQGSASKSYLVGNTVQNVQFEVSVDNSITNKIGGNGEVFDSYSLQMQIVDAGVIVDTVSYSESATKHTADVRRLTSNYSGHADSVNITLSGIDNGFWGGYYGPIMCGPALTLTSSSQTTTSSTPAPSIQETPVSESSPSPTAPTEPSQSPTPQDTPSPEASSTPTPTAPSNLIYGTADEGWSLTLTAPEGYKFTGVQFASYGVPDNYTAQWCDSPVSVQKVSEAFIGQTTGTISADNGVFGDPCGGTYKRLSVILTYEAIVPIVVPAPEPTPEPTPTPVPPVEPPVIIPEPTIEPTPEPTEEPTVEPTPEPEPSSTTEPSPTPEPSEEPTVEPTPDEPEPTPEPEPSSTPEEPTAVLEELATVEDPHDLTEAQVEQLVEAAEEVLATAEQGSPEYEQALEALAVAAVADDPQIDPALAAIPLLGGAAEAVLETFNALGNVGADMAPAVREEAEKTVIASVIAAGAAVNAVQAAAGAAASTTSSTPSSRKNN